MSECGTFEAAMLMPGLCDPFVSWDRGRVSGNSSPVSIESLTTVPTLGSANHGDGGALYNLKLLMQYIRSLCLYTHL